MTCRECGFEVQENASFCPRCGASQEQAEQELGGAVPMPVAPGKETVAMPSGAGQPGAPMPTRPARRGEAVPISLKRAPEGTVLEHNGKRYLQTIEASSGWSCQRCGTHGRTLHYGRFRRIIAAVIVDFIKDHAGYFCGGCRRRLFWEQTLQTLVLGWWGFMALLWRNPMAIAMNFAWLFGKPLIIARDETRMVEARSEE
jgi:hypothetical protein